MCDLCPVARLIVELGAGFARKVFEHLEDLRRCEHRRIEPLEGFRGFLLGNDEQAAAEIALLLALLFVLLGTALPLACVPGFGTLNPPKR